MDKDSAIFVAGHRGLVGSGITRLLETRGFRNLILAPKVELDLTKQAAVDDFFRAQKIDYVFVGAARVGGIEANKTYPVEFLYENLMISLNVIKAAAETGVQKLLFLGSNCVYPRLAPQPMREDALLTGPLEPTNEAYALAKIAGLKLCQYYFTQYGKRFISVMPTSLYGPNDNFDLHSSHVLPGLLRKFHDAKQRKDPSLTVWGTGKAIREFLHVDDLSEALLKIMDEYDSPEILNVGSGVEVSIEELIHTIKEVVGFQGDVLFDSSKPDGTPRKFLNCDRVHSLGWKSKIDLRSGIESTYRWAVNTGVFSSIAL